MENLWCSTVWLISAYLFAVMKPNIYLVNWGAAFGYISVLV